MFDFPLAWAALDVFCRGAPPSKLAVALTHDLRYPEGAPPVTLLDNHDLPRLMSVCGHDVHKVEQALAFLFASRGIPSIMWGTEVGFEGAQEPENRSSMRFEPHPLKDFITARMQERLRSPPLRDGRQLVLEVSDAHVLFARVAPDGSTVHVRVENGAVQVSSAPPSLPEVLQRTTRPYTFEGTGLIAGSLAELGDWDKGRAVQLPVTLELPVRSVVEFKHLVDGEFEPGPNRVAFVAP